jgi:hypothetical protein
MAEDPQPSTTAPITTQVVTGKTAGDVLDGILTDPKRWFALMAFLAGVCGLVLVATNVASRLFGVQTKEIEFGSMGSHILFASVDKKNGGGEYVVVVNPEGWQQTAIEVRQGDHISFHADGKICIDLHDITEKVENRLRYEEEWAKKLGIRRNDSTETRIPEDYFTDEQKRSLVLNRPWVDPGGFDLAHFQPTFRSRRGRYLLPDENAAALVAAVPAAPNNPPSRADAFLVGRAKEDYVAGHSGRLWFTVNDVQFNDPNNPGLFYNDNVGSFWVRVSIKPN